MFRVTVSAQFLSELRGTAIVWFSN